MKAYDKKNNMTEAGLGRIQSFAFIISVVICVLSSMFFITFNFMSFSSDNRCEIELDEKINTNDSPVASMIRLPNIGFVRAEAIEAYREDFMEKNGNSPAFVNYIDLQNVKGIGPKTVKNISRWLKFE